MVTGVQPASTLFLFLLWLLFHVTINALWYFNIQMDVGEKNETLGIEVR